MKKKAYNTKIDALIALYRCNRSCRLHNNHYRYERRIYEYNNKYYLTSMAKFIFNLTYRNKDGGYVDDENVWVHASNKLEAFARVKEEYPKAADYTLVRSE